MKTKIKYYAVLLFSAFMLACEGLDPLSYAEINPSIFPKTETDLQAMVMSCYNPLRGAWGAGINHNSERGQMPINDCCTEILAGTFDLWDITHNLSFTETNIDVTHLYYTQPGGNDGRPGFIGRISRCTQVMSAIENSDLSQALKNRYIAEVRCARAYLSYILYDMYGPLVIAPFEVLDNPLKEVPLPRLSREEMIKFIEEDLMFAAQYLPDPKQAEYGRFSKGLANTLLIRLYLHSTTSYSDDYNTMTRHLQYYDSVEVVARRVMEKKWYSLVNEYPYLFQKAGQVSSNPEYIFVIPSSIEGPNDSQWQTMVMPTDGKDLPVGWDCVSTTWWFYDTFEPEDTRKTYIITEYEAKDGTIYNRANPPSTGKIFSLGPIAQKYELEKINNTQSNHDIILYRYPEILLSLAEAIVMKPGGSVTQEAVDLMNEVRRRAKLSDKTLADFPTPESFIDQLLTERSHEFWCESGQYRADLIRHDKLFDRVLEVVAGGDPGKLHPTAGKHKYLFPLPLTVIVDGKGMVKQNPGYNQ